MGTDTRILVGYEKLLAYQVANEYAWEVYILTDSFPKDELYGITSQLRRSALSVPLNIIEGHSRYNKNEFRNFLRISLGSLAESGYLLKFALKRTHISEKEYQKTELLQTKCGKLLWNLMKSQI